MILAIINNTASIFHTWDAYHNATFSPDTIINAVFTLRIYGRTYAEKRAHLRRLAIDIQAADLGGISYGELYELRTFLIRSARKYGLIQEFRHGTKYSTALIAGSGWKSNIPAARTAPH